MSDISQGPGWWQAADGKFYAPEQHPDYQAPAAAPPPAAPQPPPAFSQPPPAAGPGPGPMAPPPQMGGPPGPMAAPPQMGGVQMGAPLAYTPPPKSSNKGCLIAIVIVIVIMVLGTVGVFFLIKKAGDSLDSAVGVNACPFASNADISAGLGAGWTGNQFGSFTAGLNTLFDGRVLSSLPNTDSCNLSGPTSGSSSGSGQATKYEGGDAQAKFDAELTKAKGSPDTSGVVSVTGADYFLKDVSGVGDQAFCTKPDAGNPSGGVLARKGNTLVYVSIFDVGVSDNGDATCTQVQGLATKLLG